MTKDEKLQREGLDWLAAQLRWERRLSELRGTAGAGTGRAVALTMETEAVALAA